MKIAAIIVILFLGVLVFSYFKTVKTDKVLDRCWRYQQAAELIPKYKNTTEWRLISGGTDLGGGGPCSAEVYFWTNDSQNEVISFYKEGLSKEGWTIGQEESLRDVKGNIIPNKSISFNKENIKATLTYYGDDDVDFAFSVSIK